MKEARMPQCWSCVVEMNKRGVEKEWWEHRRLCDLYDCYSPTLSPEISQPFTGVIYFAHMKPKTRLYYLWHLKAKQFSYGYVDLTGHMVGQNPSAPTLWDRPLLNWYQLSDPYRASCFFLYIYFFVPFRQDSREMYNCNTGLQCESKRFILTSYSTKAECFNNYFLIPYNMFLASIICCCYC